MHDFAWSGAITYAFPTTSSSYDYNGEKNYSFSPISSQQQSLALYFMEQSYGSAANDGFSVEGFTNANFEAEVPEPQRSGSLNRRIPISRQRGPIIQGAAGRVVMSGSGRDMPAPKMIFAFRGSVTMQVTPWRTNWVTLSD
ncbi:hypothetical protein [Rhizobium lentis]|uniref:hypothetical protein n=1 Tax=Rhizobium lentis TaxID=1138194 RepID=UPI0021809F05